MRARINAVQSPPSVVGFTLIELLVVVGIIGIFASLLAGGLSNARFRARVVSCTNNYRQWGIAVGLYSSEDKQGRLPSMSLPLAKFSGYGELSPWFVPMDMGKLMEPYGLGLQQWFCPARLRGYEHAVGRYASVNPGRQLTDVAALTEHWRQEYSFFGGIDHNWYVPRTLEGSNEIFPDPRVVTSRHASGWPRRTEDPSGVTQPILTDWVLGNWNDERTEMNISGGHEFPRFRTRNINLLFLDGHVENRVRTKLTWQIDMPKGYVIPY